METISDLKEVQSVDISDVADAEESKAVGRNIHVRTQEDVQHLMWWDSKINTQGTLLEKLNERVAYFEEEMQLYYSNCRKYDFLYKKKYKEEVNNLTPLLQNFLTSSGTLNLSFNGIQVAIDSHYNALIQNTPRITFQGQNASSEVERNAKMLNDWTYNCFKKGKAFVKGRSAGRSSMIFELSHVKLDMDKPYKSFKFYKIPAYNWLVENPYEGSHMRDEFFERKKIQLWQLEEMCNKKASLSAKFREMYGTEDRKNIIYIYEGYKTQRRKCMWVEKMLLLDEGWKYDFVPYQKFFWDEREEGYVPSGIASTLEDCQSVINWLLDIILMNAETHKNNALAIPLGSSYQKTVSNRIATMFEYNPAEGGKPITITPNIIHEQYFYLLFETFNMALKKARVSDLQQQAIIPKNIRGSGKALDTFSAIDASRFVGNTENYTDAFVGLAHKMIQIAINEYSDNKDYAFLKFVKRNKELFFKEVDKQKESMIAKTPQAKLELANSLLNSGGITIEQYLRIAEIEPEEIPDVVLSRLRRNDAIHNKIDRNMKAGTGIPFDEYLGVQEQEIIALKRYDELLSKYRGTPEEDKQIQLISDYLNKIKEEKEKQFAQQQAQLEMEMKLKMVREERMKDTSVPPPKKKAEKKAS